MSLRWPAVVVVGMCASALGCSPATQVNAGEHTVRVQTPSGRELRYRFGPVPSSWQPIDIPSNDLAWHDSTTDGVAHVDHACSVGDDVPLSALVQHLLIGFTQREYLTEETITMDGREARHVIVRARLDGVPTMLELYVLKKDGCVYDLGYVAAPSRFGHGTQGFTAFVHGFGTLTTGLDREGQGPR